MRELRRYAVLHTMLLMLIIFFCLYFASAASHALLPFFYDIDDTPLSIAASLYAVIELIYDEFTYI